MKLNKKLIKQLAAGEIVLHNEPKNPELTKAVCGEVGWPDGKGTGEFYAAHGMGDLPKVPIADFLLPEPKFKVGDKVRIIKTGKEYTVLGEKKRYLTDAACYDLTNKEKDWVNAPESALELVPEPEYIIGQYYEFQRHPKDNWKTGKFIGVSDCKGKKFFLSEEPALEWPVVNMDIREVEPKETTISTWVGVTVEGEIGGLTFTSEKEARRDLPVDAIPVLVTGTYTI